MTSAAPASPAEGRTRLLSLPMLVAMVVGSMVGAGVFSLPSTFAEATGVYGALIAWAIAGGGMLLMALIFERLSKARPDLDSGIFAYAKAGFGPYVGFFSAFGYWAGACIANVTYWVLISSTLGAVMPALGEGDTFVALALGSAGIWIFHVVIARGIDTAAAINTITTIAKLVPLALFLIVIAFAGFSWETFTDNLWASTTHSVGELADEVRATMLVTVFVFLGVEGASVFSRYARRREDVGRATVTGFLGVLALFVAVTMLSYGVLPREELASLRQPSAAGVIEAAVGPWGGWMVGIGLLISVLGAYLAWTLLGAEVLFAAATGDDAPRTLTRVNRAGVPIRALLATSGLTQVFLVLAFFSEDAFDFSLELTSAITILPYLLTAAFALKLALGGGSRAGAIALAAGAFVYTCYLVYAMGLQYVLIALIVYAPATLMYVRARRERGLAVFTRLEAALCVAVTVGAVIGVWALATGRLGF
ncbi:basic amino acid/polyamine antiporter [Demequina sp. NBRC 110051]|uniref:basic amino acid/polyamine antiporter n=1 Tax=Demequina sp. NBRC 110051 TaxID=1570340 RepID=UPI000A06018E|nr:basic amino acid/polyamine antiporter [Demequina sp. NBRC 110051]